MRNIWIGSMGIKSNACYITFCESQEGLGGIQEEKGEYIRKQFPTHGRNPVFLCSSLLTLPLFVIR